MVLQITTFVRKHYGHSTLELVRLTLQEHSERFQYNIALFHADDNTCVSRSTSQGHLTGK